MTNDHSLCAVFAADSVIVDLKARDKKAAIRELLQHLVARGVLDDDAARKAEKIVHKREGVGSTGIGKGLAIPHAKECPVVDGLVGVFGRSREGLPFDAVDGGLVHVLFLVLSPKDMAEAHLAVMRRIAQLHRDENTLKYLATDPELGSLTAILKDIDDSFAG